MNDYFIKYKLNWISSDIDDWRYIEIPFISNEFIWSKETSKCYTKWDIKIHAIKNRYIYMKEHFEQDILDNLESFMYEICVLGSDDSCKYTCDTRFEEYNDEKIHVDVFAV